MAEEHENKTGAKHHHHPCQKPGPIIQKHLKCPLAYVANLGSGTLSVVNIPHGIELMEIDIKSSPISIDISPDKKYVFVYGVTDKTSVYFISTRDNRIVDTIDIGPPPGGPGGYMGSKGIKVSPDNKYLYVVNYGSTEISVIDISKRKVAAKISLPYGGQHIDITPDGNFAYVTMAGMHHSIAIVDLKSNLVVKQLDFTFGHTAISIAPCKSLCVVSSMSGGFGGSSGLIFINTDIAAASDAIVNEGESFAGTAFDPTGKILYAANLSTDSVSVIDVFTHSTLLNINVEVVPFDIAVTSDGEYVVVSNEVNNSVSIIDAATNTVKYTVAVGENPTYIAILDYQEGTSCGLYNASKNVPDDIL